MTDIHQTDGPVIVGAGLAGLFTALKLAPRPVTVLSPASLGQGASSAWAQGGIAAALAEGDTPAAHAADTMRAGAGLVDPEIAAQVAAEAPARIADLVALGAPFDRDASGGLVQSREAAHSFHRVVRVKGDTAGAAIMAALIRAVRATPSITVVEGAVAEALLGENGRVTGVVARHRGRCVACRGTGVVLATGGIGSLYAVTSNPGGVGGQGLGIAARAGAVIRDPEFVQFHPTGLAVDRDPMPLASEALRGEGAWLIDERGRRFMPEEHPDAELAPRDVVARALHRRLQAGGRVFLDTRAALGSRIESAFPTITAACRAAGIDPATQPIPVAPVQHYHMGGVETDARGRTSCPGLRAVGEVACTGLHGANRLASNSLLEALVFGARVAADLDASATVPRRGAEPPTAPVAGPPGLADLRRAMTEDVGVEREACGLRRALATVATVEAAAQGHPDTCNATAAATLIAAAALERRESRGGHARLDHPASDPSQARPTRLTLAEALSRRAETTGEALAA